MFQRMFHKERLITPNRPVLQSEAVAAGSYEGLFVKRTGVFSRGSHVIDCRVSDLLSAHDAGRG